jgi:hypothetical protein
MERGLCRQECLELLLGTHTHIEPEILCQTLPLALHIKSRGVRFTAISTILRKGVSGPNLHLLLQNLIIEEGKRDVKLIELLLKSGASINYIDVDGHNSIALAAERGDTAMIELLCRRGETNRFSISTDILSMGFRSCINLQRESRLATAKQLLSLGVSVDTIDTQLRKIITENDLNLLSLMLRGRSKAPLQDTELFIIAIRAGNVDAVNLLLQASPAPSTLNAAFSMAIGTNLLVNIKTGEQIGELLLQNHKVGAETVNDALIQVVQTYRTPFCEQYASLLVRYGADVNWKNATATMVVATMAVTANSELNLLRTFLQAGARMNVIVAAFINKAADSRWMEQMLLDKLELCIRPVDGILEQREGSILFLAMSRFPKGAKLIEFLLKHGWSANNLAACKVEQKNPDELVPALLWAICQPNNNISTAVIKELLKGGGK